MLRIRIPLALLAASMAALVVGAAHTPYGRCGSNGHPALGIVEVSGGDAAATAYVDDRNYVFGNGVWAYLETNGVHTPQGAGVFRGDVTDHNLQRGSPCGGAGAADECTVPDPNGEICVDDPELLWDLLVF